MPKLSFDDRIPIDIFFPEKEANIHGSLESYNKHLYRPNTYLHKWWARRSGGVFRYILKQLVDDSAKRDYFQPGGLEGKVILDPMMGGGTTLHEAIRMGANCIGIDVDPIPVLQTRASLSLANIDEKVRTYNTFLARMRQFLEPYFKTVCPICGQPSEVKYVLHTNKKKCGCGEVGVVDSFVLREEKDGWLMICPRCYEVYEKGKHKCHGKEVLPIVRLVERRENRCGECGKLFQNDLEIPFWQRHIPIVIVGNCLRDGEFYKGVEKEDLESIKKSNDTYEASGEFDPAEFRVPSGPKSDDLHKHNVHNYLDLFTRRQLLFLRRAIELMNDVPPDHALWLALIVSTSLEFNCLLCGYKGSGIRRPGAIRHVFSHHAYSFPYTALENNPVYSKNTSGTLGRLFFDRIEKAGKWAAKPIERKIQEGKLQRVEMIGEIDGGTPVKNHKDVLGGVRKFCVCQADFRNCTLPKGLVDFVVTDPPYYDSVQYSDLSAFFRAWLNQFLPNEADWFYLPQTSAVAEDVLRGDAYGDALTAIWKNCGKTLKKQGRLIFTFHHWKAEAWAQLTLSLKRAGFTLCNRYVVVSENPISVHIRDLQALKHDCILVLRPDGKSDKRWTEPQIIKTNDSYRFCTECGSALGFFLQSDVGENDIKEGWKKLLRSNDG